MILAFIIGWVAGSMVMFVLAVREYEAELRGLRALIIDEKNAS